MDFQIIGKTEFKDVRSRTMIGPKKKHIVCLALILAGWSGPLRAQMRHITVRPLAPNIIVPQSRARAFAPERRGAVEITGINVLIDVLESTATTSIEIRLQNTSNRRQEA